MLIWNYWPGPQGGAETQCRRLARELVRQGVSCTVLTRRFSYCARRSELDDGVDIRRVGWFSPIAESFVGAIQKAKRWFASGPDGTRPPESDGSPSGRRRSFGPSIPFLWLERVFFMMGAWLYLVRRKKEFTALHVHESHWIAGFGAWLGVRLQLPVVVKEASFPVLMPIGAGTPFASCWDRWRLSPSYLAQTEHAAKSLSEKGVRIAAVIPNGVELPSGVADVAANLNALYVGNFRQGVEWKAFDVLFDAWKMVVAQCPDAQMVIAGGGEIDHWRDYTGRLGIAGAVDFKGSVADVASLYGKSALFVLPSRREGMSNALLEAQSWGVPAVVSDIPGNRAVVDDRVNGLVVPVGNAEALAEAMLSLIRDRELRSRLGRGARLRAEGEWSIASVASRVLGTYNRLATGNVGA